MAFVVQDICADAIDPFTFNAARFLVAAVALLAVCLLLRLKKPERTPTPGERKQYRRALLLGGLCCGTALAAASAFQQAGFSAGTEAGKAGFITALYVVLVPVAGLFFGRRPTAQIWLAVALAVAALYLLCVKRGLTLAPGDLLVLACALCFTVQILLIDHFSLLVAGVELSCVQFFTAALLSALLMLFFGTTPLAVLPRYTWPILYMGVISGALGYTLQIFAQKGANPTVVCILLSLESIFSVLGGWLFLGQHLTGRETLGCVLMFAAVILAQVHIPMKSKG
jgi:drug/metabolite transporter (DMT)-like permease